MCVRNMDKGERYANVDPLTAAAICQFSDLLRFNPDIRITPLVLKFHEPGHKVEEHEQFSFNLAEGVGLSDGECPEQIWAGHNALGNSTKTVGPGLTLWKHYKVAITERNWQEEVHRVFTQSLPPDMVSKWDDLCVAWEADKVPKTVLNPFCVQSNDLTEDKVHKELAEEEEACRRSGGRAVHDMSPSAFMIKKLKANLTAHQDAHIAEKRSLLRSKIKKFEELHVTYMPGLLQFVSETQEADDSSAGTVAEEVQLWLPSSIPVDRRGQMVEYKNKNVQGQWDGTQSWAGIDAIHEQALAAALKYRMAREAKLQWSGPEDWERTLCKLEDNDIRSYQDPDCLQRGTGRRGTNEDSWGPGSTPEPVEHDIDLYQDDHEKQDGMGQTWHTLSWIWMTMKINLEDRADENNDEVLHSEWCCSRARAHRAHEEVLLLREEMHRTLKFLECTQNVDAALHEALEAYALKQSDLQHKLAVKFQDTWSTALKNTPMDELDHEDDINEDVGIWDDEDEQELDDEDFAGL
ncbi:hypothetical protein IW262DRAFT_1302151 [Armillaria fumosa]|nr:hypothetical protein IW262DRAFT_1302151 [Armillaria fumosa]